MPRGDRNVGVRAGPQPLDQMVRDPVVALDQLCDLRGHVRSNRVTPSRLSRVPKLNHQLSHARRRRRVPPRTIGEAQRHRADRKPVRGGVCNETVRVAGSAAPARLGGAGPVARGAGPLAINQVATAATSSNPASSNPASILENLKLSGAASPPKR
jgi:hypothetical protein